MTVACTPMKRGDIAVQLATKHSWRNASRTEWARMMFVLQDCKPIVIGGERLKEDLNGSAVSAPSGNHA